MPIPFSFVNSQVSGPTPMFVAVGNSVTCWSEDNGVSWTAGAIPGGAYQSVAYGNGRWVAVGGSGVTAYSLDGKTFISGPNLGGSNLMHDITFFKPLGLFVTAFSSGASNQIRTSPDGITWTTRSQSGSMGGNFHVGSSDTLVVFGRAFASSATRYSRSSDTIGWTLSFTTSTAVFGHRWLKDRFISGHNNIAYYSTDGISWSAIVTTTGINNCPVYISAIDTWGFINANGTAYYSSTNGVNFTRTVQSGLTNVTKAASSPTKAVIARSSGNNFFVTTTLSGGSAWSTVSVPAGVYNGIDHTN